MFDWRCFDYGDNQEIDEEQAKQLLIRHKQELMNSNVPPPSFLGIFAGAYDFLMNKEEET